MTARREPRQDRAQKTVEAILEAARLSVIRHGTEALTTNGVARLAGVSIGSLYQYFPSKRALLAELRERHQREGEELFIKELATLAEAPVDVAIRHFVAQMMSVHRRDPELHRALETHGRRATLGARELRMARLIELFMSARRADLVVQDYAQAAMVVGVAVEAITHAAVLVQPRSLDDQRLIEDITRMLTAYLTGRVPAQPQGGVPTG